MIESICIFEDEHFAQLNPFARLRACYDIQISKFRLFDRLVAPFSDINLACYCRQEISAFTQSQHAELFINTLSKASACLFLNGRILMDNALAEMLKKIDTKQNALFTQNGIIVAVFVRGAHLEFMEAALKTPLKAHDVLTYFRKKAICKELEKVTFLSSAESLPDFLDKVIFQDFKSLNQAGVFKGKVGSLSALYHEDNIYMDVGSVVEDFVLIDARKGPVILDKRVTVKAHSHLEGPLYVGPDTIILGGYIAKSSIGKSCKIAGEVQSSVIFNYSNKAHSGFVGNSVLGEWVNLGALSTTSNLKINYKEISVHCPNQKKQTQRQFFGALVADYVKTGIHSSLNAGTCIDFGSSLFGSHLHKGYIAPFTWGEAGDYQHHNEDAFFETVARMMQRRDRSLSSQQLAQMKHFYQQQKQMSVYQKEGRYERTDSHKNAAS